MTSEALTIRTAEPDDISVIGELLHQLDELHVALRPDLFQSFNDPAQIRDRVEQYTNVDNGEIYLAEVGDETAGLVTLKIKPSPSAPMFRLRDDAVIDNLIVRQQFRGMGVGKKLLNRAVEWSRVRNVSRIEINVWIENRAGVSFFNSSNFVPMCQRMELPID